MQSSRYIIPSISYCHFFKARPLLGHQMESSKHQSKPGEEDMKREISQQLSETSSPSLGETLQHLPSSESKFRDESMPNLGTTDMNANMPDSTGVGTMETSRDRHFITIVRNFTPS
jgi:hypothetical protein